MVVAMRSLRKSLVTNAPAWAIRQLENGKDSRHLRILAGLSASDGPVEIERVFDQIVRELGIRLPSASDAAKLYAMELAQGYLDGIVSKYFLLQTLGWMYIDADYEECLYPFYNLCEVWDDLKTQTFSFYYQDVTRENFDDLLLGEIAELKKTVGQSCATYGS
jgi:hypothetical protein